MYQSRRMNLGGHTQGCRHARQQTWIDGRSAKQHRINRHYEQTDQSVQQGGKAEVGRAAGADRKALHFSRSELRLVASQRRAFRFSISLPSCASRAFEAAAIIACACPDNACSPTHRSDTLHDPSHYASRAQWSGEELFKVSVRRMTGQVRL